MKIGDKFRLNNNTSTVATVVAFSDTHVGSIIQDGEKGGKLPALLPVDTFHRHYSPVPERVVKYAYPYVNPGAIDWFSIGDTRSTLTETWDCWIEITFEKVKGKELYENPISVKFKKREDG